MAYRYPNRHQATLFPPSIDDYVLADDPVRVYDTFVENLNLPELGIEVNPHKIGNAQYDPKTMLKLLLYGYSYGVYSSRKLERAAHHNLTFIWLVGDLKPDHKTIAEFRRHNKKALKNVLRTCARLCIELDLIDGTVFFVDGSKIRANAASKNTWNTDRCKKVLVHIDERINTLLDQCERIDTEEANQSSYIHLKEELLSEENRQKKIQEVLDRLEGEDKKKLNTTDPDCYQMKSRQGKHAGYNMQAVVDEKHGLFVHTEAVSDPVDTEQFAQQILAAEQVTKQPCEIACADAGYCNYEELKKIENDERSVLVPSAHDASGKKVRAVEKEDFQYDEQKDVYVCPEGKILVRKQSALENRATIYAMKDVNICKGCCRFGICTKAKSGRHVLRYHDEKFREKISRRYHSAEGKIIYKKRMTKAEKPFGHIKRSMGFTAFHLRGIDGVNAETSLLSTCYNLTRMMTIMGTITLMAKMIS